MLSDPVTALVQEAAVSPRASCSVVEFWEASEVSTFACVWTAFLKLWERWANAPAVDFSKDHVKE